VHKTKHLTLIGRQTIWAEEEKDGKITEHDWQYSTVHDGRTLMTTKHGEQGKMTVGSISKQQRG
jgi:hypothetical protein